MRRIASAPQRRLLPAFRDDRGVASTGTNRRQLKEEILFFGLKKQSRVSMTELFKFGLHQTPETLLLAGQFLHEEIPVRLAHRVRELKKLPLGLAEIGSIRAVRQLYEDSFTLIRRAERPTDLDSAHRLNEVLFGIKQGPHRDVQTLVAEGLRELCGRCERARNHNFSGFLDTFYSSRIGIRLLIGQYNALCSEPTEGFVGVIQVECSLKEETERAVNAAAEVCRHHYGDAPPVVYEGFQDISLTYIPNYIHYIVFELTKNSMRAVAERGLSDWPPVVIAFSEGKQDICIRISDRGGGIMRENVPRIWDYTYSTAVMPTDTSGPVAPMAGFGHGLPFSRLYAQHFGGSLEVLSMDGHGTDVFVFLSKITEPSASRV